MFRAAGLICLLGVAPSEAVRASRKSKRIQKIEVDVQDHEEVNATFRPCSGNGKRKSLIDWTCVCNPGWTGHDCSYIAAPIADVPSQCYNPGGRDGVATCEWYFDCLGPRFPGCEGHANEYATSYGGKYCQAFTDRSDEFSPAGAVWIDAVKLCLQEELVEDMRTDAEFADCTEIRRSAFDSHPKCYLRPIASNSSIGVCSLVLNSIPDIIKILEITWDALFSRESVRQMIDTAKGCGVQAWRAIVEASLRRDGYEEVADMLNE